ncbi:hypothetical protein SY88_13675 [Clostridiales bacterium PH28_bin88]|nr:hypothetical protein SY88_13675 [Clostridiales bacterium PH28_bin88]
MTIAAERRGKPLSREVRKAGARVPVLLDALAGVLPLAKQPWPCLAGSKDLPKVLRLMVEAVAATGDETMTPMAAVAGTFADLVADFTVDQGATKVLVNNGGDIALRLKPGESTRVGIAPRLQVGMATHFIPLDFNSKVGGVATSGLGGRSFTLGVADAVVSVARNAALADACATLIGNYTNVEFPGVTRRPARELDPDTDIPDLLVTTCVGQLPEWAVEKALDGGVAKAKQLAEKNLILGAVIFVAGRVRMWPEGLARPLGG